MTATLLLPIPDDIIAPSPSPSPSPLSLSSQLQQSQLQQSQAPNNSLAHSRMSVLSPRPPPEQCCSCCRSLWSSDRPWTKERIAHLGSNVFILMGTLTALVFAIYAVRDVTREYVILTIFIVGGTLFGGGCLLALVNVSWLSRRPGVRVSAIQLICNVVLLLITSYLGLLFWPYPTISYSILFAAGLPMFVLINLPSCFVKKYPDLYGEGDTVCLDQDALDDATIVTTDNGGGGGGVPHFTAATDNNCGGNYGGVEKNRSCDAAEDGDVAHNTIVIRGDALLDDGDSSDLETGSQKQKQKQPQQQAVDMSA